MNFPPHSTLHQVKFVRYTKWYKDFLERRAHYQVTFFIFSLASDDDAIDIMDFRDVTLASYDDDVMVIMDFRDVTLAYDDDANDIMASRDVTIAYDDYTKDIMGSRDGHYGLWV